VLREHEIADAEVKGPFVDQIPAKMEEMAKLDRLSYKTALEALAEKFHMDDALLKALNPGKAFQEPGTTILVAMRAAGRVLYALRSSGTLPPLAASLNMTVERASAHPR
jgi:hypothetical protein